MVPESIHQAPARPLRNPRPAMPMVEEAPTIVAQKVPVSGTFLKLLLAKPNPKLWLTIQQL